MTTGHHVVTLLDTHEQFRCSDSDSVLHGMARLGKRGIPVGCRGGGCGICRIQVVRGSYHVRVMSRSHVTEHDMAQGIVLACRVIPDSDLDVRAIGQMQKAVATTVAWQSRVRTSATSDGG